MRIINHLVSPFPYGEGGGRQKKSHLRTPHNHKVFVTIRGLTDILTQLSLALHTKMASVAWTKMPIWHWPSPFLSAIPSASKHARKARDNAELSAIPLP